MGRHVYIHNIPLDFRYLDILLNHGHHFRYSNGTFNHFGDYLWFELWERPSTISSVFSSAFLR